jgi:SsrA-binding protein
MNAKIVVQNRRARHDYHVLEKFEAGIALHGTEVKSLRQGHMVLKDSYCDIAGGEIYLVGAHISPYEHGNIQNHDPERRRKLLMHKREILRLGAQIAEKGLALVPLQVYFKDGKAKVEVGLCRGKKAFDKRETIKEREMKREVEQAVKSARQA